MGKNVKPKKKTKRELEEEQKKLEREEEERKNRIVIQEVCEQIENEASDRTKLERVIDGTEHEMFDVVYVSMATLIGAEGKEERKKDYSEGPGLDYALNQIMNRLVTAFTYLACLHVYVLRKTLEHWYVLRDGQEEKRGWAYELPGKRSEADSKKMIRAWDESLKGKKYWFEDQKLISASWILGDRIDDGQPADAMQEEIQRIEWECIDLCCKRIEEQDEELETDIFVDMIRENLNATAGTYRKRYLSADKDFASENYSADDAEKIQRMHQLMIYAMQKNLEYWQKVKEEKEKQKEQEGQKGQEKK